MSDINEKIEQAGEKLEELNNTPDTTSEYDQTDINNNKIMAILSYISFLFLIPLFCAKESKFARFHVNQGIVLFITNIIINFLYRIIGIGIIRVALWLASAVAFVLAIIGIVNVIKGRAKELPIIGKFRIMN